MKKLPKIFLIFFFSIFILQMACFVFLLTIPQETKAAGVSGSFDNPSDSSKNFTPQVTIPSADPDLQFQKGIPTAPSIAKYIKAIYNYAIGIVGILAAIVLMFGGVIWLTAGGSSEKVTEAKAWIGASLTGLVLALCSYMILNTINPNLVSFKDIAVTPISEMGCCEKTKSEKVCNALTTEDKCESGWNKGSYTCANSKCVSVIKQKCADKGGLILPENESRDCMDKCKPKGYLFSSFSYALNKNYYFCCICNPCGGMADGATCGVGQSNGGRNAVCIKGECGTCANEGQVCTFNWCCNGTCCDESATPDSCIAGTPINGKYCTF
ncbi:MAG: pilin [Patescibacteria group bacterium]